MRSPCLFTLFNSEAPASPAKDCASARCGGRPAAWRRPRSRRATTTTSGCPRSRRARSCASSDRRPRAKKTGASSSDAIAPTSIAAIAPSCASCLPSVTQSSADERNDEENTMAERVRIIGSYLSPYVRKVLVVLDLKNIPYEIDPIVPFFGDDRFSQMSPPRRIPVLIDNDATLADSSVICQYIEDRYPQPAVYPANIVDRARARWLEEYADSRMGEVFIWRLFNQVAIKSAVWGEQTDKAVVEKTLRDDMPRVLDYLETQVPSEGFIFGSVSI